MITLHGSITIVDRSYTQPLDVHSAAARLKLKKRYPSRVRIGRRTIDLTTRASSFTPVAFNFRHSS